jgi:O-antigen/teichoic acid export membrane protein
MESSIKGSADSSSQPPAEKPLSDRQRLENRGLPADRSLREHTARGTVINSAFQVGFAALNLTRRFAVAAFLTTAEYGIWGLLITTVITLVWLKQIGISDKYVQQDERDQEAAFQKAFTLELLYSLAFFVFIAAVLPLYGLMYGHEEIVFPGLVLSLVVPISALQSPIWVAYRQMRFVRQRTLESVDPIVAFAVTIALAVAGTGYWCLVIGSLAGAVAGALIAIRTSRYPLAFRFERGTLREYVGFSWPLVGFNLSNMAIVQGSMIAASAVVGLAGVGAIALASAISQFADRLGQIIGRTIYPAVCAVAERVDLLFEAFVKSNRLALMWAMPFGIGVALFAADAIEFIIGERWRSAAGLVAAFGVIAAFRQVAFNWTIFLRAVGDTRPIFYGSLVNLISFLLVTLPLLITAGLTGFAIGMGAQTAIQIVARGYFLLRLFKGFNIFRHLARVIAPTVPAATFVLAMRGLMSGERSLELAVAELILYVAVTIAATWLFERPLLREISGYVRGRPRGAETPA